MSNPPNPADTLYQQRLNTVPNFVFDKAVARVFPDMIKRSVPGYAETVAMSGVIAGRYAQPNTHVYDLGCSLGAVVLAMRHAITQPNCTLVGVDNSHSMIERAKHFVALDDADCEPKHPVQLECADILALEMQPTSVTALNFVLQFIAPEQRLILLSKIAQATVAGGALILSEKICFDAEEQVLQQELHWDFKRANGYSDLEISQKRSAIEEVLIPETEAVHIQRLQQAGFSKVIRWYQCFNFVSFLAIK